MTTEEIFNKIIERSIEENKTDPKEHIIEEMAELMCELFNYKRLKPSNVTGELADVYFQIKKLLKIFSMTESDLMKICIDKTKNKFPHMIEAEIV